MPIKTIIHTFVLSVFFILSAFSGSCQKTSVYFKTNDHTLDAKAIRIIDSLSKVSSFEKIYLQGHCDPVGSNEFNDALSRRRVNEVKARFLANGVAAPLMETKALGERVLLTKSDDENGRALNRRVEIELVRKAPAKLAADEIEITVTGTVLNENKKALIAEISMTDQNGTEISSALSSPDGKYKFQAIVKKKGDYGLTYYNDSSFISFKTINVSDPKKPHRNLETTLPVLKEGRKYHLENMNFVGDTSQLVAASLPSLVALSKLMKKNSSLVIQIEGHVNYPLSMPDPKQVVKVSSRYVPPGMTAYEFIQWLSDERAKMVYNYLVEKGIKEKRMSTIGYGASKMLFPNPTTMSEEAKNRRVEINVISYTRMPAN
jgi:outer membrane protein OmpA-like peptidoglycan-associated protein